MVIRILMVLFFYVMELLILCVEGIWNCVVVDLVLVEFMRYEMEYMCCFKWREGCCGYCCLCVIVVLV